MMEAMKISKEMQGWLIGPMLMIWVGIYLTGFDKVSYVLYLPAVLSVLAFTTGLCPGMMLIRRLMGKKAAEKESEAEENV